MSDEKKQKIKRLRAALAALKPGEREDMARKYGVLTVEGRSLSMTNQCLLAFQCPTVTVVGGYQQWRKAGRQVREGEHGHAIRFPVKSGNGKKGDGAVDVQDEEDDTRFLWGTVFDIAQTDTIEQPQETAA